MPQLSQIGEIYASQLFWLTIVFGLIYFGIGRFMVPKIEATVDDRNAKITGDLALAEAARAEAQGAEEAHRIEIDAAKAKALATVNHAKARGAASSETQVKAADTVLVTRLAEAEARITSAKRSALDEIETFTVDAVQAIVVKVSGSSVDRAAIVARVKSELAHG
jgi:F-type H+-transporting ATPase subunit b